MSDMEADESPGAGIDVVPHAFDRRIPCAECGRQATRVTLLAPRTSESSWRFAYEGIVGGTGARGDAVTVEEATVLTRAFAEPITFQNVMLADFYDNAGLCPECQRPYCFNHWDVSVGGLGHCPEGHYKSLDPHWSPSDYE